MLFLHVTEILALSVSEVVVIALLSGYWLVGGLLIVNDHDLRTLQEGMYEEKGAC